MRFDAGLMLRAGLGLSALALLWIAMAYVAFAIFAVLAPAYGTAGAAGLTALAYAVVLALATLIYFATTRGRVTNAVPLPASRLGAADADGSMTALLTQLAKDHPLIAVGCAAALGIANALQNDAERYHRR